MKKGDRVALYLQLVPEPAIAMLASARIGAVHSVVFGGFSAESLRDRIDDAQACFSSPPTGAIVAARSCRSTDGRRGAPGRPIHQERRRRPAAGRLADSRSLQEAAITGTTG